MQARKAVMSYSGLSVTRECKDRAEVVRVSGEVDLYTVPDFDGALKEAVEKGDSTVIVDLSQISYLDSSGLSSLISAYRRLSAGGGTMFVVASAVNPSVRRALEITRLDALVNVCDSFEYALNEMHMRRLV